MKIYYELNLENFEAWNQAKNTLNTLTHEQIRELEDMLPDILGEECEDVTLNDFLWFETDEIANLLGFRNWEHLQRYNTDDYKQITIKCSNIQWEELCEEDIEDGIKLPTEVTYTITDSDEIEEYYESEEDNDLDNFINSKLVDEYECAIEDFQYEIIKGE